MKKHISYADNTVIVFNSVTQEEIIEKGENGIPIIKSQDGNKQTLNVKRNNLMRFFAIHIVRPPFNYITVNNSVIKIIEVPTNKYLVFKFIFKCMYRIKNFK